MSVARREISDSTPVIGWLGGPLLVAAVAVVGVAMLAAVAALMAAAIFLLWLW
jgi:hypothetical protein